MAAVLAVALLLLCGNVQSAEEGVAAYETQVRTAPSPEPSPSASSIPERFAVVEAETPAQSSTEEEAPEPAAARPDSITMDERRSFAGDSSDDSEGGQLATGEFPRIPDDDHSRRAGAGYGVRGGRAGYQSFERRSFAGDSSDDSEGGQLATGEFPRIPDDDHSRRAGAGYGVRGGRAGHQSFERRSFAGDSSDDSEGGQLATGEFPRIPDDDHSRRAGAGYGVRGDRAGDQSFERRSFAGDSSDDSEGGQLATGEFPRIPDDDHSRRAGAGYGVRGDRAGDQSFERRSFAGDSSDDSEGGQLATGEFPRIPDDDHSRRAGAGYGVRGDRAGDQSFERRSFAGDSSDDSEGGQLATGEFPRIPDDDHSRRAGAGYGVRGDRAGDQSFERRSFAGDSSDDSEGGQLATGEFPRIPDDDHSRRAGAGYGVRGDRAGDQSFERRSFAGDSSDDSEGGQLATGEFPRIPDDDNSRRAGAGYGVRGGRAGVQPSAAMDKDTASDLLEGEATSESDTSTTTGVTLRKSSTYSTIPKSEATWGKGKCTFYGGMDAAGTMSGACGYGNLYASGYGAYSTSLSSVLFKNGVACGACYEVACSGAKSCKPGSVLVTVTNFCAPNPGRSADNGGWCNGANQHFELSYPAFAKIADPKARVVALNYRRVPCKKQGGIRFTLNGNCNFNLVTITNVGGSGVVTEVYMKGDKMDWAPMSRNWGVNWQCSRNYCGKGISIKIVTSDKKVSVSRLAGPEWAFGKTYIGQQVY